MHTWICGLVNLKECATTSPPTSLWGHLWTSVNVAVISEHQLRRHLTCWRSTVCYRLIASEVHYYHSVLLFITCVFMCSLYILVSWERDNFLYIFFLSASFKHFLTHFVFKIIWLFHWITREPGWAARDHRQPCAHGEHQQKACFNRLVPLGLLCYPHWFCPSAVSTARCVRGRALQPRMFTGTKHNRGICRFIDFLLRASRA